MHTPNIDAFSKTATVFEQGYVQSQMCVPTRNSFMSGRRYGALFRQKLPLDDAIGSHACPLETLVCV
jgi:hypothetical protein